MTEKPRGSAPARRPGGRSARVREAVLTAALDELSSVGYTALSVAGVAERAGVNKTSLYRRWGDKESLLSDALAAVVVDPVEPRDTGSLEGDLRSYARGIVARLTAGRMGTAIAALLTPEALALPAVANARDAIFATRRPLSAEIIRRAVARGDVPEDTDADLTIDHLVAPIYFRLLLSGDPVDEACADTAARAAASAARAGAFAPQ
ncbi:TetR/AcrR family transcriptional regulator [Microbacterium halophytorum]|uniref:TetR/AcrR family transcriptional regulator n=1 Tax=Microbacterium halophytorum TaxID=2067568 RepID=UPI000CFBDEE5|nr:TetR/AcrR family transcriptional regulator [Microbacterium halophytorum]